MEESTRYILKLIGWAAGIIAFMFTKVIAFGPICKNAGC